MKLLICFAAILHLTLPLIGQTGGQFQDWKRDAAKAETSEDRIGALNRIACASAEEAKASEIVRAIAASLKDVNTGVRVHAA